MQNLYKHMSEAFQKADIKPISDDTCCRLMAWLYKYGGGNEAVVYNVMLRTDILYAQKRLRLEGGETPDTELFPLLQSYLSQVKDIFSNDRPEWVDFIDNRYGLKTV